MALSFGRGKKGESDDTESASAPEAVPGSGAHKSAGTEGFDESWFEEAFDEESAAQTATQEAVPDSDFSMFANLEQPAKRPAKAAATSFDMADTPSGDFAPSEAFGAEDSTPFDTTSSLPPAKAKGGLKKILPLLGLLLVLGGGAYFWISQQGTDVEEGDVTLPSTTRPAPRASSPPATQPGATKPAIVAPTGKAPVATSGDPKVKAQLKKLWDEGAAAKKAGKTADARKKWQQAVKLAKAKPGTEQSAKLIQDAIDKLK